MKKTKFFHPLFAAAILGGYFLTDCSKNGVYPVSFLIGDVLFFVMFFMINKLQSEDMESCWEKNLSEKEAIAKQFTET